MTRLIRLMLAGLRLVGAALAQKVVTDFDDKFDFSKLRRYAWKVHPRLEQDPTLLRSVGAELVRMAVSDELIKRGYEPTEEEFADFYVTFFGGRKQKQEVTAISSGGWYGWGPYWHNGWTTVMVKDYIEGTLVLDFVDAKSKQLVWRAYCQGAIRNPSKRDKVINKAVNKAFAKFPPKQ